MPAFRFATNVVTVMTFLAFLITYVNKGPAMTMNVGQRYRRQNTDCRCEVEVIQGSTEAVLNPRCCCGWEMKKPYTEPTLKILVTSPRSLMTSLGTMPCKPLARMDYCVRQQNPNWYHYAVCSRRTSDRIALMAELRIGTSGFTAAGWPGTFYPEGLPEREYISY